MDKKMETTNSISSIIDCVNKAQYNNNMIYRQIKDGYIYFDIPTTSIFKDEDIIHFSNSFKFFDLILKIRKLK